MTCFQSLIRRFSNAAADLERLKETTAKLQVKCASTLQMSVIDLRPYMHMHDFINTNSHSTWNVSFDCKTTYGLDSNLIK